MNLKPIAIALVSATLVACGTNPNTPNTNKGAAIGAIGGAIIGATAGSSKNRERDAVIGAVLGAAVGAGIGSYMDKQEAALRESLEGSGVDVARDGDEIRLTLPEAITFGFDQSDLDPSSYDTLSQVAAVLSEYDQTRVQIDGHTDSQGGQRYNQLLSERRASSVANYLQQNGVYYTRINTRGYGAGQPVADNSTDMGRAQNRRVEMTISEVAQN